MIRKTLTHFAFSALMVLAAMLAYWTSDREPPSYYIASWVMTRDIVPGGPISIRFILVRHKLCGKRIEQSVEQVGFGRFPFPARVLEMSELGLDVLTLEEEMPSDIAPGDAVYIATFLWRCPGNFIQQVNPVTLTVQHPIKILGDEP